jgi:photosystem II stability/assembly factor-like uncharacterized protein
MKQFLLLLFSILFSISIFSQYATDAPWVIELQKKSKKSKYSVKEISKSFDDYWNNNLEAKDKKGSGFKPFKRWENRWELQLDKNGFPLSNKNLFEQWEAKNQLQKNSNDISNWQNLGPYTQLSKTGQGRANVIAVDPNNPNIYYAGAPAGGIWKSTDAGNTWIPLSDYLPQIGVSGIAIDPNDSNIIYIATGDDDAMDTYSVGVMKSTDGGITWNITGLQFNNSGNTSHEIYIHPNNSNILWVATSVGVYKTTDAGANWINVLSGNIQDLKIKPTDPDTVYAVTKNKFYKSTDGGSNFNIVNSGLPNDSNRMAIDVTPANPNVVYLLRANSSNQFGGFYKSNNSGDSFVHTNEFDDIFESSQSWYDMAMTVSDTDENIIFVGVLNIWKSTDGGDNFVKINEWYDPSLPTYTHADIHFLRYFNGSLFCGSDGGVYKSTNDGSSFIELNEGLSISQFYRIANAIQTSDNIVGGLQDNGGFGYSNNNWNVYHGGDGMDCAVDPINPNKYYGFTQFGGSLNVTFNGGLTGQGVVGSPEQGNWITPMVINNEGQLFAGYSKLYTLSSNNTWLQVSGDVFGGKLHHIETDPSDVDIIYASRHSTLYKSTNKGLTFAQVYYAQSNISSIEINTDNNNIVYLTTSSGEDGQVLKSVDGGASFTNITGNLPSESKLIIKHVPHSANNDIYIGTSLGVYHFNDTMTNWETFSNNLANVPVRDIEINLDDHKIIIGTYGRGVWESPIEVIPPDNDVKLVRINPQENVSCSTSIVPEIIVKNQGSNTINQIEINYEIDGIPLNYTYNGSIASLQTETINLPVLTNLSIGVHTISVTSTIANDAYPENNTSSSKFYVNNQGANPTIVNPFNDNSNLWLTTGTAGVWNIAHPITNLLGANTNTGYVTVPYNNYPDNVSSYLTSPCYDLTSMSNATIKFDMAFDLEQDWDVLYVEYSIDQGQTWEVLGTADDPNWYNSSYDQNQLTIGKQWTGTNTTIEGYSHDVSFLTNESNVMFRFSFLSDQAVNNEGVLIDNFVIEGDVADVKDNILDIISIFPNPSKGKFTVSRSKFDKIKIEVYDLTGKLIFKKQNIIEKDYILDLQNISKGVYFVTISSKKSSVTKKLIKE